MARNASCGYKNPDGDDQREPTAVGKHGPSPRRSWRSRRARKATRKASRGTIRAAGQRGNGAGELSARQISGPTRPANAGEYQRMGAPRKRRHGPFWPVAGHCMGACSPRPRWSAKLHYTTRHYTTLHPSSSFSRFQGFVLPSPPSSPLPPPPRIFFLTERRERGSGGMGEGTRETGRAKNRRGSVV
jgi:hypothetical protein